jgi:hypothetical protein
MPGLVLFSASTLLCTRPSPGAPPLVLVVGDEVFVDIPRLRMAIYAKPEHSPAYGREPTGGPIVRPIRRFKRWIGVKAATFQKHRTGF